MMEQRHHTQNAEPLPLPRAVPEPDYPYSMNASSQKFYNDCAEGATEEVRKFVEESTPTAADRQHGLEEACHNFEAQVARYLIQECRTQIHTGCFRRESPQSSSQNIFTSDSQNLIELLEVLIDNEWHPNQALSSLREEDEPPHHLVQEVALHHERCLRDVPVLQLLLAHGADPTIARWKKPEGQFGLFQDQAPLERNSGDIFNLAVKVGTPEIIDLLLLHGVNLQLGCPLHSLVQRSRETKQMPEVVIKMAEYLLGLGVNIDGVKNVFPMVRRHSQVFLPYFYQATALSHAAASRDFAFYEWLLERGANPEPDGRGDQRDELVYGFDGGHELNSKRLKDLVNKISRRGLKRYHTEETSRGDSCAWRY